MAPTTVFLPESQGRGSRRVSMVGHLTEAKKQSSSSSSTRPRRSARPDIRGKMIKSFGIVLGVVDLLSPAAFHLAAARPHPPSSRRPRRVQRGGGDWLPARNSAPHSVRGFRWQGTHTPARAGCLRDAPAAPHGPPELGLKTRPVRRTGGASEPLRVSERVGSREWFPRGGHTALRTPHSQGA